MYISRINHLSVARIGLVAAGINLALALLYGPVAQAEKPVYDVVIYGEASAGVAVVQVRRIGKTAILVGPDTHLGGLSSGGLGQTDSGN